MKSYVLSWSGSGKISEIYADNDDEAVTQAIECLGDVVTCENWNDDGSNDDGQACKRILFWADEESAANDDGSNAIAELSTVGQA